MFNSDYIYNESELEYNDFSSDCEYGLDDSSFYADFSLIMSRREYEEKQKNRRDLIKDAGLIAASLGGATLGGIAIAQLLNDRQKLAQAHQKLQNLHKSGLKSLFSKIYSSEA